LAERRIALARLRALCMIARQMVAKHRPPGPLPYEVRKARADKKTARRQKREDRRAEKKTARRQKREDRRAEKRGLKHEIAKHG
jgi:hypothetical protein